MEVPNTDTIETTTVRKVSLHLLWIWAIPYALVAYLWFSKGPYFDKFQIFALAAIYCVAHFLVWCLQVCCISLFMPIAELTPEETEKWRRRHRIGARIYYVLIGGNIASNLILSYLLWGEYYLTPILLCVYSCFLFLLLYDNPYVEAWRGVGCFGYGSAGMAASNRTFDRNSRARTSKEGKDFLGRVGSDNAPWEKHMREDYRDHAAICQDDDPWDCDNEECY